MKIMVNGKPHECEQGSSIDDLLQSLGVVAENVAVVYNDDVLSPKRIPYTLLKEGDHVELLTLAAGG